MLRDVQFTCRDGFGWCLGSHQGQVDPNRFPVRKENGPRSKRESDRVRGSIRPLRDRGETGRQKPRDARMYGSGVGCASSPRSDMHDNGDRPGCILCRSSCYPPSRRGSIRPRPRLLETSPRSRYLSRDLDQRWPIAPLQVFRSVDLHVCLPLTVISTGSAPRSCGREIHPVRLSQADGLTKAMELRSS